MGRIRIFQPHWMKPFHDVHKHLGNNEKWLQFPEKKHAKFEKDFNEWHDDWQPSFKKSMDEIENAMKQLEKKMEE